MWAGSIDHGSHVAMLTPLTPLHLGQPSRVQRYSSSMHRAMVEDSLMTRYDDDITPIINNVFLLLEIRFKIISLFASVSVSNWHDP